MNHPRCCADDTGRRIAAKAGSGLRMGEDFRFVRRFAERRLRLSIKAAVAARRGRFIQDMNYLPEALGV